MSAKLNFSPISLFQFQTFKAENLLELLSIYDLCLLFHFPAYFCTVTVSCLVIGLSRLSFPLSEQTKNMHTLHTWVLLHDDFPYLTLPDQNEMHNFKPWERNLGEDCMKSYQKWAKNELQSAELRKKQRMMRQWRSRSQKINRNASKLKRSRVKLAIKIMRGTLQLSNLNFPPFLVHDYFIFKADFQSNQAAISVF